MESVAQQNSRNHLQDNTQNNLIVFFIIASYNYNTMKPIFEAENLEYMHKIDVVDEQSCKASSLVTKI